MIKLGFLNLPRNEDASLKRSEAVPANLHLLEKQPSLKRSIHSPSFTKMSCCSGISEYFLNFFKSKS